MRRILFVKAGKHAKPIAKAIQVDDATIADILGLSRAPVYLGRALPALGDASRYGAFVGPDFVVLDLPSHAPAAKRHGAGFYLIPLLHPSNARLQETLGDMLLARQRIQPLGDADS